MKENKTKKKNIKNYITKYKDLFVRVAASIGVVDSSSSRRLPVDAATKWSLQKFEFAFSDFKQACAVAQLHLSSSSLEYLSLFRCLIKNSQFNLKFV